MGCGEAQEDVGVAVAHPVYIHPDGTKLKSVTTIIKNLGAGTDALVAWGNKIGREEDVTTWEFLKRTGRIGTAAHDMIECDILGKEYVPAPDLVDDELDRAKQCFANYIQWKGGSKFKPIRTELSMVSAEYRYGGTCDCVAEINGEVCLFDWKSSSSVHETYIIQVAAYGQLLRENNICDPQGYHLLRIDRDGASWSHHYWRDVSAGWEVFKHLIEIDRLMKSIKV